jgi:hypothetical protein
MHLADTTHLPPLPFQRMTVLMVNWSLLAHSLLRRSSSSLRAAVVVEVYVASLKCEDA